MNADMVRALLRIRCNEAGGQNKWADAADVTQPYVSQVLTGMRPPGPAVLRALGLQRRVTYELITEPTP